MLHQDIVDLHIQSKTEYITLLYREIETELIYAIVEMLVNKGYTATAELKLKKLMELTNIHGLDKEVLTIVSKITGKPLKEIQKAIPSVSEASIDYKELNKALDLGLIAAPPSVVSLKSTLERSLEDVTKEIGLVQTKIREYAYKDVRRIIDKMVLETQLGTMTNDQAIAKAVQELARQGITASTYLREGKEVKVPLETTLNRIVRTEFIDLANKSNEDMAQSLDVEHVYVSQHLGARNKGIGYENHEKWQGKVYNMDELESVCGYGEMLGLGGINCRHIFFPHIKGVSVVPKRIDDKENTRVYELTQIQRRYERAIRESKRTIHALERVPTEEAQTLIAQEKKLLRNRQARIRHFIKQNSDVLKRDYSREKVIA